MGSAEHGAFFAAEHRSLDPAFGPAEHSAKCSAQFNTKQQSHCAAIGTSYCHTDWTAHSYSIVTIVPADDQSFESAKRVAHGKAVEVSDHATKWEPESSAISGAVQSAIFAA